jgi:hypothetical protein
MVMAMQWRALLSAMTYSKRRRVGEQGRIGCFSPLVVLIAPKREILDPTAKPHILLFMAAVVNKDKSWCKQKPWR